MTRVRLLVEGEPFVITVEDGIAQIRGENDHPFSRGRGATATLPANAERSKPLPVDLRVEALDG